MKENKITPHQSGTFDMTDEPTSTHHHPESIGDMRVCSWCCAFCGLGQMYNDTCPFGDNPQKISCLYPAHNRCFFMYLFHRRDATMDALKSTSNYMIRLSLSCFF